jgi:hypothetical protein
MAQAPSAASSALPDKRLEAYKIGDTTIDQFFADGWTPGDIYRTKAGILAYRLKVETHTFEFVLGLCEGTSAVPQLANALDMSLSIMKMGNQSIDQNWKDDMNIPLPTGTGVRCIKSHYLKFVDSKLAAIRDLRVTP